MAIDFPTLRTDLYDWATAVAPMGVRVIWYRPNAPRPDLPYVTLSMLSFSQVGWDYIPRPDTNGDAELTGDREFTLQMQAFGDNAFGILEDIRTSLQKPSVLDTLRDDGIVFVNQNEITNVTALLDTEWEPRASMDIQFRVAQTAEDDLGKIETVELQEILNDGQSDIYDETVTITAAP